MINLILAIHNHQPVGNFGAVFEKAFKKCYWPIINTLAEFPKVKLSIHHSGPLLDWAKAHEPSYIPILAKLVKAGQIEILGGGYYEPILASIPPQDASGQLQMMKDFWKSETGITPSGIWTTERIWEPSLASLLAENGILYTILDDEHFRAAGMIDEFILNYHLAERHGKTVGIFASDQTLRYKIPFKLPEDVIGHLLYLAQKYEGAAVTYGDDGEKFGMWPGTFEWVIEKGWLKKLFALLTENAANINCTTLSRFYHNNKPSGTVYLPTCSYHEMGEWAMPAHTIKRFEAVKDFLTISGKWEEAKPFVRGGYWDNFLTKYPEANYMHKKMLYVSKKVEEYGLQNSKNEKYKAAQRHLYMAQCNCPYWHGLFGGLYLNYLRHAIYKNLIEAQNIIDLPESTKVEKVDIDCDLTDEVILSNKNIISVIKPNRGASLVEFSHRRSGLNLADVLARREEGYHKKGLENAKIKKDQVADPAIPSIHDISKTFTGADKITYDPCGRHSFCDHIWPVDTTHTQPDAGKGGEIDTLCNRSLTLESVNANSVTIRGRTGNGLSLHKTFKLSETGLHVEYKLLWESSLKTAVRFGTELNLTLLAGNDEDRFFTFPDGKELPMDSAGNNENSDTISITDNYYKFELEMNSSRKMDIWRYPVLTVSQSESGFDLLYQGSCIIWSVKIPEGTREFDFAISLNFKDK